SLPIAMSVNPDADFFFNNPYENKSLVNPDGTPFFSEARAQSVTRAVNGRPGETQVHNEWIGNFFPDMRAWDKLDAYRGRGAGGQVVWVRFPGATTWAHMSVFPAQTYKKAHRHGPGVVIVIPAGEGYSVMWPEGEEDEKVWVPWNEASLFVPPFRWFHQHFNLGNAPARYLALHPPRGLPGYSEAIDNPGLDQIDYADEDPAVRRRFEEELAKRGMKTGMPAEAYKTRNYQWTYEGD